MQTEQLPLFPHIALGISSQLTAQAPLDAAIKDFHKHMTGEAFTENTIKAFLSDLRLLKGFIGADKPIGEIATKDLNDFLIYLRHYRGVPCSAKSYSRRVTTLKVFFTWLAEEKILPFDPAAPLIHQRVPPPLPRILYDDQVKRLLETTQALLQDEEKSDARPHLLVTLILQTGIKKTECMGIKLGHIDLSDPKAPVLYIRYEDPRKRRKERKLQLPPEFPSILKRYLAQYNPQEYLFECTARNLEYVLSDVAERAGIKEGVSFEALRMTCAVRDYRTGMPLDKLRKKLGLSSITWGETSEKIKQLASPAL